MGSKSMQRSAATPWASSLFGHTSMARGEGRTTASDTDASVWLQPSTPGMGLFTSPARAFSFAFSMTSCIRRKARWSPAQFGGASLDRA